MAKSRTHHIVRNPDGGWSVKKGGAFKASGTYKTQGEAISYGRRISKNQSTELIIHGRDGRIRDTSSHGSDLHPPRNRS